MSDRAIMTDRQKIKRVLLHLTCGHLDTFGGYEFDHVVDGRKIYVAALDDDGSTRLLVYTFDQLIDWHNEASEILKHDLEEEFTAEQIAVALTWSGEDWREMPPAWSEALRETEPNPAVLRELI